MIGILIAVVIIFFILIFAVEKDKQIKHNEIIKAEQQKRKSFVDEILNISNKLNCHPDVNSILNEFEESVKGIENEIRHVSFSTDQKYIIITFQTHKRENFLPPVSLPDKKIQLYGLYLEKKEKIVLLNLLLQKCPSLEYHYYKEFSGVFKTRNLEEAYFESLDSENEVLVLWNKNYNI